jgi:predicted nucleic acid-binding protein
MPCLIADSGPLIAFAKLGLLELPTRLFGRVAMPETVFAECQAQAWLADAEAIRAAVDAGHLEVLADFVWPAGVEVPRLDAGEMAVLSLAAHLGATVLMDERRGRELARKLGLQVVGVCGLLLKANRLGGIGKLAPLLEQLHREGYFISPELTAHVLALVGES